MIPIVERRDATSHEQWYSVLPTAECCLLRHVYRCCCCCHLYWCGSCVCLHR